MKLFIVTYLITISASATPKNFSCRANLVMGAAVFAGLGLSSAQPAQDTRSVFAPVLLHSNFKVWHPRSGPGTAARVEASAGTFTDEAFTQEFGNPELNEAPRDVQGELRLMQPKLTNALPADEELTAIARWETRTQGVRDHLADLRKELAGVEPAVGSQNTVPQSQVDAAERGVQSALAERRLTLALMNQQKALAKAASADVAALQTEVNKPRNPGFFCSHFHWNWVCKSDSGSPKDELAKKTAAQASAAAKLKRLEGQFKGTQVLLSNANASKTHATEELAAAKTKQAENEAQATAHRERLQAEIHQQELEAQSLNGFAWAPIPNVSCRHPLLYHAIPGTQGPANPLLGKDSDLAPSADVELRVCVNEQSRAIQTYIFRGGHELYRADIARGARGQIEQIVIENDKHQVLEDHHWFFNRDGSLRYALTFRTERNEFTSIYTDIPRE